MNGSRKGNPTMKNRFKLILVSIFMGLFAAALVSFASAEVFSGHIEYSYNGDIIVNNDWTIDSETGLLYIKSVGTNGWNECGSGSNSAYTARGGWYKYNSYVKKVVLDGRFSKISGYAFMDCTNLEEVVMTSAVEQIAYSAFENCSSLHTIWIDDYVRVEGMADFRNVPKLDEKVLKGTQIKTIFTSDQAGASISNSALPDTITEIFGTKDSVFHKYATKKGIKFTEQTGRVYVDIHMDGKLYNTYIIPFGMTIATKGISANGSAIGIFEDENCTIPFDMTQVLSQDLTLYAKKLMDFGGWSVRTRDYEGLRAEFDYYLDGFVDTDLVEVARVGAIAGKYEYALNEFDLTTEGVKTVLIYENGYKVGASIRPPVDNKDTFAISAIGYEGSEEDFINKALENIVVRGFVVLKNKETGKEHVYYTDAAGSTLAYVSKQILASDEGKVFSQDVKAFVGHAVEATRGKGEDTRYTKEELMELLTAVYNDNSKIIVGEEINSGTANANDVIKSYMDTTGQAPSIIGMDLARHITATDTFRAEFVRALIDYCRDGGIITASSHFTNPLDEEQGYRGYLGKEKAWEDLIKEGTPSNLLFKRQLNSVATLFRELQNNDIPILWRPLHEMNGNWFWWCIRQENNYLVDQRSYQELWKYVHDYFEKELGLTNILWVYAPNNDEGYYADVEYCYPGDEYVDMTGLDWYTKGNYEIGASEKAYPRMMEMGMPVALSEYGSNGTLNSVETWEDIQRMYKDGMKITYVLTWSAQNTFINSGRADELMAKPDTLSQKEVYAMFKAMELE